MNKNNKNNRSSKYRDGSILEISVACLTISVQNQTQREKLPLGAWPRGENNGFRREKGGRGNMVTQKIGLFQQSPEAYRIVRTSLQ